MKISEYMKTKNAKNIYQILVIIDDFLDDQTISRNSKLVWQLFTRGRHYCCSTVISTQKYRSISPVIRVNAIELYSFRLRNSGDLEALIEEISALASKKELLEIYEAATKEPYSFLYIKLNAKDKNHMFYQNFSKRFVLTE